MTNEEMINWIDNATYAELLNKWRFEPLGSKWFLDEVGEHFKKVFSGKHTKTPQKERVAVSKMIGWD